MSQRILIIDDDESIRTIFSRFLRQKGYAVDCAVNGTDGLRQSREQVPDLIITDIMMPEADGLEVLMTIKKERLDVPVIAVSGGMHAAPLDFLPMAKKFGAKKVLYKPVDMEDLFAAIQDVLPIV